MVIVVAVGFVGLLGLAGFAWRRRRRAAEDERLAEIARAGMTRDRFPSMYVGPDTTFGLREGTPCRRLRREQANVVRVRTPDGREWNVPGAHVAHRPGPPPAPDPRPRRRQIAPQGEVYR